jgi:AcrR family transcriptional regulator
MTAPSRARRVRRTQAERTTETRARLAEAAMVLLQKKGYAGFRVQEVSRIAAVSRGAQTHHFPTKDSLVIAAVEQMYSMSEAGTLKRIASLGPRADAVAALIEDGVDFFLGPHFAGSLDLLHLGAQDTFRETVIGICRVHRLRVESAWLEVLVARGASRASASEALWLAFSVIRGHAVRRFIDDDAADRRRRLARLREIVTATLLPGD